MSELWQASAAVIAARVRGRETSAREEAEAALSRLDAVNGPLNAVVQRTDESALSAADAVDAAVARGEDPGPLAGVPVTVKVNVDQAGFATTNGLTLQKDLVAEHDNPVVANLKRAGAVIVGRTNTPAFSLRWFARNALHGNTLNPHDRTLTPGGSSGGAASACAAGIGAVAHGTDIAGSIRYPAYACNLHGLRPTLGRIPAANLSGPDRSMGALLTAVSGPLARTMEDVSLALRAMSAPDVRDPWQVPAPLEGPPVPRRVAYCPAPEGLALQPAVRAALDAAAAALEAAGWTVEEAAPPSFRESAALNLALWMAEFKAAGGEAKLEAEGDPDSMFVAPELMKIAAAGPITDPMAALQRRTTLLREWLLFLETFPVLLCPTSAETPFENHSDVASEADFARIYEAQLTQAGLPLTGLPGLNVATGSPGAPMGVQLVGRRYREDVLLEAGAAIAAASPAIAPLDPFAAG